ncbi:MAG: DUF3853 family protein [Bacteroides sp.]|nr:DUF3853 family protein [Bacteroides sp.]
MKTMNAIARYNPNTRIIDLTVGQLVELIEGVTESSLARSNSLVDERDASGRNLVYGLGGIARVLNCSRGTVCRIKKLGAFEGAVWQCGHLIVADADKLLECFHTFQKSKYQTNNL